jgi:hypothetical protein
VTEVRIDGVDGIRTGGANKNPLGEVAEVKAGGVTEVCLRGVEEVHSCPDGLSDPRAHSARFSSIVGERMLIDLAPESI